MANYEYIIASLPVLDHEGKSVAATTEQEILQEILSQLSAKDKSLVGMLQDGWKEENLTPDFYAGAIRSKDKFIREYFRFDLAARNAKVAYLNRALGRPDGTDAMVVDGFEADDDLDGRLAAIFAGNDLLQRERAVDDAYWSMCDDAVLMDVFSIDIILAFVAKLHIVERWLVLDEQTGREMFRRLVDEVRGTFKGVDYKETK